MFGVGIDSGSTTTKGLVYDGKNIIKKIMVPTGPNPKRTIKELYHSLTDEISEPFYCISTGYGRNLLEAADKRVTEITCHGKGASYLCPDVTAVIDIGGQDSKVMTLNENQNVQDFLMNDKCAAGTGRFLEMLSRILHEDLEDLDKVVAGGKAIKISSMCTVFAESEVISLLAEDVPAADIALGVVTSICERTANFAGRLSIGDKIFFSGGLSKFDCINNYLEKALNKELVTHPMGQYAGAIGAAILGFERLVKS
jgi:predicted CoA-substrate-specific enzyme activase